MAAPPVVWIRQNNLLTQNEEPQQLTPEAIEIAKKILNYYYAEQVEKASKLTTTNSLLDDDVKFLIGKQIIEKDLEKDLPLLFEIINFKLIKRELEKRQLDILKQAALHRATSRRKMRFVSIEAPGPNMDEINSLKNLISSTQEIIGDKKKWKKLNFILILHLLLI